MMTRRKSVHESTIQAQLQLQQERAAEEQLAFGVIESGIANILTPSAASSTIVNLGSSGSSSTGGTFSQSTSSKANGSDAKKPSGTINVSSTNNIGLSAASSTTSLASSSLTTGKPSTSASRSKTPRISKRSAPIDVPQPAGGTMQPGATPPNIGNTTPQMTATTGTTAHAGGSTMAGVGGGLNAPNPVQQTLAQNGMDPDEIPKFKGYRIIEIDHFLQWAAYSQFMHSKHCPGGLLKPYQEYISGCYSTFAMKCSKCMAIITRSSENYIHHNKLMNRLVKGTVQLGKDYDEMQQFMESLEVPFVTREEFQSIRGQVSSSLEDQSSLQRAVEELELAASVASKRKRHGSCKYHYEVLKVYLNKKMKKIEENLQLSVNDSVALAVNAHLKNVSHVQLVSNGHNTSTNCTTVSGAIGGQTAANSIGNVTGGTIVQTGPITLNGAAIGVGGGSMYSNTARSVTNVLSLPEPMIGGGGGGGSSGLGGSGRLPHH